MAFLSRQSTRGYRLALGKLVLVTVLGLLASPSLAQQTEGGPFAALPGTWNGTGLIALSSGAKERIRCRATYRVEGGGTDLRLEMSCASDSYKFELQSHITAKDNTITGSWNESTRGVGGSITGTATAAQVRARAEGQTFTAILSMTTRGTRQSVSIQSPGSEMANITIELARGAR